VSAAGQPAIRHGAAAATADATAAATAAAIIQARGLTRRFGDVVALDGLDFDVAPGELFGIVGPDGAGKTTTLRILAGVLRPTTGDAVVDGVSMARDPERVKHRLAYMSQRFGLYRDLTVIENLRFYADLFQVPAAEREARLERLFRFSNLGPFRDRLAGDLSGGMKQKLGLSCALIHQPAILLLDEPTFGVDPISRRDLWLIVHEMVGAGVTVVVSTAYMDEAERFDRLILLDHGRIVAMDTPDRLQRSLAGEILAVVVDRARVARDVARRHPAVRRAALFGNRVHVTVGSAAEDGPAVRQALTDAGLRVERMDTVPASMEDAFIEYVAAGSGAP
jgi:ABC-2 type transport system ATP-binding protein